MQSFTGQHPKSANVMILMMSVFLPVASTAFLLKDVSKISSSTSGPGTVLLSTLANQTNLKELENDQSTQSNIMPYGGRSLPRFLEKLRTSKEIMNPSSSASNKEESNKNNTSHIFEKEVIFESKKSLNLVHYENQTQEHIDAIFKNNCNINTSKILSEVMAPKTIKEELKEVLNTTDLFKFCTVPCLNYPLWIFNASLIRPNFEKKVNKIAEISDNSKNDTNSNDTEILIYNEEDTSNNSFPKVETEYNENETTSSPKYSRNRSSFNGSEVIPFPKLEFDIDEIDAALTFTCQDRCGVTTSFPCSCSAACFIYGNCCDNFSQDCPHVWSEARTRFADIRGADVICDEDMIYKVVTCPKPSMETEGSDMISAKINTSIIMKDSIVSQTGKSFPSGINTTPETFNVISSNFARSTEEDRAPQDSIIQRLYNALSLAPITDSETGITFVNKAIYDCHNMPDGNALRWSLRLNYDLINPTKLEDFEHIKTFDEYLPEFDGKIFTAHSCLPNVIETCKQAENQEKLDAVYANKCQDSTAYVRSKISRNITYRNRFCAYCNEGRHNGYSLWLINEMQFKGTSLHILMSLSEPKTFSFKLNKSLFQAIKLPWSHAKCAIRDQFTSSPSKLATTDQGTMAAESQSVCSATCADPSFTVRSDGLCKAKHKALLGIADDGLAPLCLPAMKGLAKFLVCGLEQEVDSLRKADFSPPSVSIMFDSTYNKSLYIVSVYMALPQDSSLIFSNSKNDIFQNILHVALMAKSFKNYRLSEKFCQQNEKEKKITDLEVISTSPIANVVNMMSGNWTFSYAMKKLRGEILDNQTTTVCLSALNSFFDTNQYPLYLLCMDDPVYERDASWIHKFRHSPCFAHLENLEPLDNNQAIRGTENQEIWRHWALSLNVFVALIIKI